MVSRIGLVVCGALVFSFATCSVAAYAYRCEPAAGLQNYPWVGAPSGLRSPAGPVEIPRPDVAARDNHSVTPGPMPPENNQAAGYLGTSSGRAAAGVGLRFPHRGPAEERSSRERPENVSGNSPDNARAVGYAPMVAPGAQESPAGGRR